MYYIQVPNIVLIMVDDMGIGDIPCFGKFMNVYNIFLNESRENSLYMTRRESPKPATSLNPLFAMPVTSIIIHIYRPYCTSYLPLFFIGCRKYKRAYAKCCEVMQRRDKVRKVAKVTFYKTYMYFTFTFIGIY